MSYNTELQGNNAELEELLKMANSLPDAVAGSFIVTATAGDGEVTGVSATFAAMYAAYQSGKHLILIISSPYTDSASLLQCDYVSSDNIIFSALSTATGENIAYSVNISSDDTNVYLSNVVGGVDEEELNAAVESALTEAKESGEFNGADGADGNDGRGITSITRTSGTGAAGTTDTYTITYTDGTKSTFTVYNGKNGADGKDGTSVTVSKVTESTASGGTNVVTFSDGTTLNVKNGKDGAAGADGKSAYAYAQDGGFTGTEAEFAEKMAGEAVEPADDDVPKVFLTGSEFSNMTNDKNEVNMELDYHSKTKNFHSFIVIKYQGTSSLNYAKKNFTIKLFDDEARATKQKHLFRDWKYEKNKFVLKANYIDHSHARNIVCANLWDEVVGSRSDYTSLPEELRNSPKNGAIDGFPIKLYVNGTYQGIYTWNIGKDDWQWGMDEDNANHTLLCVEHNSDGEFKLRPYNFRALWNGTDGYFEVEVGTAGTAVTTGINNLISFVMNNNGTDFKNGIGQYLDIQSAIDYYIHQYVICGLDGLAKNMLLGTYDGKKWYCGAYDMDSTFGLFWNGSKFIEPTYKCPEDYQEKFSLLWERIEENYWTELKARYAQLRKTVYSVANMVTHFERFMDSIGLDLYAEDLEIFSDIPNGSTNNIKQLRNYIRDRLAYCDIKITNGVPATAVTFNKTSLEFDTIGNTATLTATVTPSNHTDEIMWLTSNASIATVTNGVVKAVADGECEIRAKCGSGYAVCAVKVSAVVEPDEPETPTYTNLVPISEERILTGDTNNSAVFTYDGVGYANNHRLSSSGYAKRAGDGVALVTGFIPANGGDIIRIGGILWTESGSSHNYVCAYKSDYTYIGAVYGQDNWSYGTAISDSCVIDYDIPLTTIQLKNNSDIAFVRISCSRDVTLTPINGADLIVTINEEIS